MSIALFVLNLLGAVLALPSAILGYRATHGLEGRPWERRVGPLGAAAVGAAGVLVILSGLLGALQPLTGGQEVRGVQSPTALIVLGGAAAVAVALTVALRAAERGEDGVGSRHEALARRRYERALAMLLVGALVCGAAWLPSSSWG